MTGKFEQRDRVRNTTRVRKTGREIDKKRNVGREKKRR